jgi:hypothetical protein
VDEARCCHLPLEAGIEQWSLQEVRKFSATRGEIFWLVRDERKVNPFFSHLKSVSGSEVNFIEKNPMPSFHGSDEGPFDKGECKCAATTVTANNISVIFGLSSRL